MIADNYDVTEYPDGSLLFTLKDDAAAPKANYSPRVRGTRDLNPDMNLGHFTCETSLSDHLVLDALPGAISLTRDLSLIADYDSRTSTKLVRTGVQGKFEVDFKLATTITAALEGKVECKVTLGEVPVLGGPVGMVLGGYMVIGGGFEISGKIEVAQFKAELDLKSETTVEVGLANINWPQGALLSEAEFFATADNKTTAKSNWSPPTAPVDVVAAYSNVRLEPALMGFGFMDFEFGLKWRIPKWWRKWAKVPDIHRAKLFAAKGGLKLSGNFAIVEGQLADPDYKSKCSLDLEFTAGPGEAIENLAGLFKITLLKDLIKFTEVLALSPTPRLVKADKSVFEAGETVTFTVELEDHNTTFPLIGYNVDEILIYQKPGSGSSSAPLIARLTAAQGQRDFTYQWVADDSGTVKGDFFAFVKTKALPFDTFFELELDAFTPPGRATLLYGQDGDPFGAPTYAGVEMNGSTYYYSQVPYKQQNCGDDCFYGLVGVWVDWCEGSGGVSHTPYTATVDVANPTTDFAGMSGYWQTTVTKFDGGPTATIDFSGSATASNADPYAEIQVVSEMDFGESGSTNPQMPVDIINDLSTDISLTVDWNVSGTVNLQYEHSTSSGPLWGGFGQFSLLYVMRAPCSADPWEQTSIGLASISGDGGSNEQSGTYTITVPPGRWQIFLRPIGRVYAYTGLPEDSTLPSTVTTINGRVTLTVPQ